MLLNLSKHFHFNTDGVAYEVDYLFTNQPDDASFRKEHIRLTLNIVANEQAKRVHTILKPTSVLYQSNEVIEKMIEEDTILVSAE